VLEVALPESYKQFLQELGYAYWPVDIYGIMPGGPPGMQVVTNTLVERHEVEPALQRALVPFSPDGWGNHYCLNRAAWAMQPV
jgi:hypothetical protein